MYTGPDSHSSFGRLLGRRILPGFLTVDGKKHKSHYFMCRPLLHQMVGNAPLLDVPAQKCFFAQ